MTGTSCRSEALTGSYRTPGSLREMRLKSALVMLCALSVPGGPLARRGSSHCPRRTFRLIAVVSRCSSEIFGSSSHACGTSPVQTVSVGTWLGGVRSCTRHSGNDLLPQSSKFCVSAFSTHSRSACHVIFSCRFPCWPHVAILHFMLPRSHMNCFGRPLSVAPNTPCTSPPSGHSGCMGLRSANVTNGHAWGFGFCCGSGGGGTGSAFGAGLKRLAWRPGMPPPSGRGRGLGWACSGAGL